MNSLEADLMDINLSFANLSCCTDVLLHVNSKANFALSAFICQDKDGKRSSYLNTVP